MSPTARNAFVMALHAVETLTGFGEDELDDAFLATPAREALSVEGVISCHDGLVEDGQLAHFAVIAICADRRAIREQ